MKQYILRVTLPDDKLCDGCPCLGLSPYMEGDNIVCCNLDDNIEFKHDDVFHTYRPSNCPLKEEETK